MNSPLRKIDSPCRPECGLPEGTTTADAIIIAVKGGATHEHAARWAGIWPETLSRWNRRGLENLTHLAQHPTETPDEHENPYINLTLELSGADADGEMRMIAQWQEQFPKDWRAIAAFMAKRYKGTWGDTAKRMELSGPAGGPIPIMGAVLGIEDAESLLAGVEARRALGEADDSEAAV